MTVLDPNMPTVAGPWRFMISHQFTSMDLQQQAGRTKTISDGLPCLPNQIFCSMDHEDYLQAKYGSNTTGIYEWCLEQQGVCSTVVFLIAPGPESKGMGMELELAIKRGQEVIVCVHSSMTDKSWVQPYVQSATVEMEWSSDSDLALLGKFVSVSDSAHKM